MTERTYRLPADVLESIALAKKMSAVLGCDTGSVLIGKTAITLDVVARMDELHKSLTKSTDDRLRSLAWGGAPGAKWAERTLKYNGKTEKESPSAGDSHVDGVLGADGKKKKRPTVEALFGEK